MPWKPQHSKANKGKSCWAHIQSSPPTPRRTAELLQFVSIVKTLMVKNYIQLNILTLWLCLILTILFISNEKKCYRNRLYKTTSSAWDVIIYFPFFDVTPLLLFLFNFRFSSSFNFRFSFLDILPLLIKKQRNKTCYIKYQIRLRMFTVRITFL